jgi:hypothetical protein
MFCLRLQIRAYAECQYAKDCYTRCRYAEYYYAECDCTQHVVGISDIKTLIYFQYQ